MMKKILIPLVALLAVASCSKIGEESDRSLIRLQAGVTAPIVRSPIDSDNDGKLSAPLTGVQFLRADGATPDWSTLSAVSFTGTIAVNGTITPATTQYYPTDGTVANIMGYYPAATAIASGKLSMTITGQEDVLYAAPASGSKTVALTALGFTHKLTQFTFIAQRTEDVGADVTAVSVTVKGANSTLDMAVADGTVSNFATPVDVTAVTNGTATLAGSSPTPGIMLEPTGSLTLSVSGSGFPAQEVTVSPETGNFLAGYRYTITLSFSSKTVTGNATIGKWQDGDGITKPIQ